MEAPYIQNKGIIIGPRLRLERIKLGGVRWRESIRARVAGFFECAGMTDGNIRQLITTDEKLEFTEFSNMGKVTKQRHSKYRPQKVKCGRRTPFLNTCGLFGKKCPMEQITQRIHQITADDIKRREAANNI